jgi:hypothetical protein
VCFQPSGDVAVSSVIPEGEATAGRLASYSRAST